MSTFVYTLYAFYSGPKKVFLLSFSLCENCWKDRNAFSTMSEQNRASHLKGGKYSVLNPCEQWHQCFFEVFEVQKCLLVHQVSALLAAWLYVIYLT